MPTRTISAVGGDWDSIGTWDEGAIPTVIDDVVANPGSTSGPLTITSAAPECKSLDLTNYTSQMDLQVTSDLKIAGALTFGAGMTLIGLGAISCRETATLTFNGISMLGSLHFEATSKTFTLADALVVGSMHFHGSSFTVNAQTITVTGNVLPDYAGTITTTGLTVGGNFTTLAALTLGGACTISGNLSIGGSLTLSSHNVTVTGSFTNTAVAVVNGHQILVATNLTITAACSGTTVFVLNGTGVWSASATLSNPVTVNTTGWIRITPPAASGVFTYTAGSLIKTNLSIPGTVSSLRMGM